MKSFINQARKEEGSVMIVALLILILLTLMGISATTTTNIEMQVAGNGKFHKMAFYAAEAGRAYVAASPELYGADNITVEGYIDFPNDEDPSVKYALGSRQSFNGDVEYLSSSAPPRGSGYGVGKFKAHRYKMTCYGYGPSNAETQIEGGFYRIGY